MYIYLYTHTDTHRGRIASLLLLPGLQGHTSRLTSSTPFLLGEQGLQRERRQTHIIFV